MFDYAETEYLRRQPKYAKSSAEASVSSAIKIKTAPCRTVMIPCRNIAALSAAQAEASARGGPPQGRAPQTSARSYDSNRSSRHPQDDGMESLILQIAGRFCTRLVRSAEDKPPLRQAAPRQNPK